MLQRKLDDKEAPQLLSCINARRPAASSSVGSAQCSVAFREHLGGNEMRCAALGSNGNSNRGKSMRSIGIISIAAIVAAIATPTAVLAQTSAEATTDLNIRSGPGPQYQVIGAIQRNDNATIIGCIQGSLWCQVDYGGRQGWAYSKYLTRQVSGQPVVISEEPAQVGIPTVRYETNETNASATTGLAGGAITGALIGGPIGAVVGGVAGATFGGAVNPPREVSTYVESHPADPVYLDGEVVVGATLPQTVELRPVPDYSYRYVYVNRQPVLVEPQTRRIVYIYR